MPTSILLRWLPLALFAATLTAGCGNDSGFDPATQARLRLVHASLAPGGQADFLLDGVPVNRLAYRQSTGYIDVAAGARTISMRGLPDQDGIPGPTFVSGPVTVNAGRFHSAVVTGADADITVIGATDEATPPSDRWSLRVVHVAQGTAPLDLYVTDPGADLNAATPLLAGIDWREVTDYQAVAAGQQLQIRLTPAGTKEPLISSETITVPEGQVASIYVFDNPAAPTEPFGALVADGDNDDD
jgi:hypothetical protein